MTLEDDDVATLPPPSEGGSGGGGGGSGGGGVGSRFRNASFMKWRQNNKSDVSGMNVDGEFKKWPHPPEALHKGKVTYGVKFLGFVNVEEPKGIEVVRSAIQKMKFNKTVKKAEGVKTAKKELVISVDSITIQDSKYKIVDHCYPLHRISFCADDKSDKRMFAFIAKDGETHVCYVFDSEKCAEEITLTVGQAFEIAYQNFVEVQGKPTSSLKEEMIKLKNQVEVYEKENAELKARVKELESKLGFVSDANAATAEKNGVVNGGVDINLLDTDADLLPMSPAPHQQQQEANATQRLDNLLFDEEKPLGSTTTTASALTNSSAALPPPPSASFSPPPPPSPSSSSSTEAQSQGAPMTTSVMPSLAPPPRPPRRPTATTAATPAAPSTTDLFGSEPFAPGAPPSVNNYENNDKVNGSDPFGHHDDLFGMTPFQSEYQPPFQNQNPIDISFGSGNFDFGSSFQQDFNQNNAAAKGSAPSSTTSPSTSNPFIQFN